MSETAAQVWQDFRSPRECIIWTPCDRVWRTLSPCLSISPVGLRLGMGKGWENYCACWLIAVVIIALIISLKSSSLLAISGLNIQRKRVACQFGYTFFLTDKNCLLRCKRWLSRSITKFSLVELDLLVPCKLQMVNGTYNLFKGTYKCFKPPKVSVNKFSRRWRVMRSTTV